MIRFFLFLIVLNIASSCRETPAPLEKFQLSTYVRFESVQGLISAEAVMKNSGANPTPIAMKDGFSFQKRNMALRPVEGMTYTCSFDAAPIDKPLFEWINAKGKLQFFEGTLNSISDFGFGTTEISRKEAATFKWKGAPLTRGETFVFIWEEPAQNLTVPMEIYTTNEQASIDFPAIKMSELAPGNWTLYLVRKKLEKLDVENVAVTSVTEFYTKPIKIKVK